MEADSPRSQRGREMAAEEEMGQYWPLLSPCPSLMGHPPPPPGTSEPGEPQGQRTGCEEVPSIPGQDACPLKKFPHPPGVRAQAALGSKVLCGLGLGSTAIWVGSCSEPSAGSPLGLTDPSEQLPAAAGRANAGGRWFGSKKRAVTPVKLRNEISNPPQPFSFSHTGRDSSSEPRV